MRYCSGSWSHLVVARVNHAVEAHTGTTGTGRQSTSGGVRIVRMSLRPDFFLFPPFGTSILEPNLQHLIYRSVKKECRQWNTVEARPIEKEESDEKASSDWSMPTNQMRNSHLNPSFSQSDFHGQLLSDWMKSHRKFKNIVMKPVPMNYEYQTSVINCSLLIQFQG